MLQFYHYQRISAKGLIKPYWILYGITNHTKLKQTLIGDRNAGGLKMSESESMNKALKASEVNASWKIIPNYMTRHLGCFKSLLSCNYKTKELNLNSIPCFHSEILNCWEMIKKIKAEIDQEKKDPYDAIIWNNQEIKIATKPIFYESWHKAGVTKVKHLLNPSSGKFLTYQEFVNLFKVKSSFTVYYGLLSAIKNKWKISLLVDREKHGNRTGTTMKKIFPTQLCTK